MPGVRRFPTGPRTAPATIVVMLVEIVGEVSHIETIAVGRQIHVLAWLRRRYGPGKWRKLKGMALVRLENGRIRRAEVHWYEAHGVGRKGLKIKTFLDRDE